MRISSVLFLSITLALLTAACSSTAAPNPTTAPAAFVTEAATPSAAATTAATTPAAGATAAATPSGAATTIAGSPTAAATTIAGSSTAAATTAASSATTSSLQFMTNATLGKILTDGNGITLYQFATDKRDTSACTGQCATSWPPLTASAAPAAPAGDSGTIGLITRPDGTKQVTYNGLPLYRYSKDAKQGDTTGQGVGGLWHIVQSGNSAPTG
jgi:predicted lipoprotein with Yx(FWY)xxD motif